MSEVIRGHFSWAQINQALRELEAVIEDTWSRFELDQEAFDAGLGANPRERLSALFAERAKLVKRQKEMERL